MLVNPYDYPTTYLPKLYERLVKAKSRLVSRSGFLTLPASHLRRIKHLHYLDRVGRLSDTIARRHQLERFGGHIAGGRRPPKKGYALLRAAYYADQRAGFITRALKSRYARYHRDAITFPREDAIKLIAFLAEFDVTDLVIEETTGCVVARASTIAVLVEPNEVRHFVELDFDTAEFVTRNHTRGWRGNDALGNPTLATIADVEVLEAEDYVPIDGVYYHPYIAEDYRHGGDEDEDEDESGLLDYHSYGSERARAVRYHAPDASDPLAADPFTLGFEAEIQVPARYRIVQRIKRDPVLSRVAILEEDGSLCSRTGFETVTGWSTLNEVCRWADAYGEALKDSDYNVDNCGLHIAVGGMSNLHVARVMGFVFDEDNRPLLRDMAGRDYNGYAKDYRFISDPYGGARPNQPAHTARRVAANSAKAITAGWEHSRYLGLNYRNDGDYNGTLEWRLFAGSGNATRIKARLQFVWAVTHYTKPALCNELTMSGFLTALMRDPHLRRHTAVLRDYIVRTAQHKARFPTFAEHADMLNKKELKKKAYEAEKRTAVLITA